MIEKIATRKGEKSIDVVSQKERRVPKIESKELESLFASEAGSRHSIAIGELQDFQLEELPTGSGILNIN